MQKSCFPKPRVDSISKVQSLFWSILHNFIDIYSVELVSTRLALTERPSPSFGMKIVSSTGGDFATMLSAKRQIAPSSDWTVSSALHLLPIQKKKNRAYRNIDCHKVNV